VAAPGQQGRKCTINNEAGIKAMTVRASIAKKYGAEDPADTIATNPLPQLDWFKERCSMFFCRRCSSRRRIRRWRRKATPGPSSIGFKAGAGSSTTYGSTSSSMPASKDKQEVLHDLTSS
jgi:hypothetical protein